MNVDWRQIRWSLAAVVISVGLAACAPVPEHPSTFLVKMEAPDVHAATDQFIRQLQVGLTQVDLPAGYPRRGRIAQGEVEAESDSAVPGCQQSAPPEIGKDCLLLSAAGDYLQVQAVTWESEVFHMYRVYVVPDELFVAFDPVKDYVAVDVILLPDSIAWEQVQTGIELAAEGLGARPITD
jgi:hypothetical protein